MNVCRATPGCCCSPRTAQQTLLLGAHVNLFGFTMLTNCCNPCGAGCRRKHIQPKGPSAKLPGDGATDPGQVPRHTFRAGAVIRWSEKTSVLESNQPPKSRERICRTPAEALGLRFHAEPCPGQAMPSLRPLLRHPLPTTAHVPRAASSAFPWHIQDQLATSKSLIWHLQGLPKPCVRDQRSCGFSTE